MIEIKTNIIEHPDWFRLKHRHQGRKRNIAPNVYEIHYKGISYQEKREVVFIHAIKHLIESENIINSLYEGIRIKIL